MTWFVFCYWYEPDAPRDPVGLVRIWMLARQLYRGGDRVLVFPPRYASSRIRRDFKTVSIPLLALPLIRPLSYAVGSFLAALVAAFKSRPTIVYYRWMLSPHPLLFARLLGTPCVCEVNGEPIPGRTEGAQSGLHRIREWLARLALRNCDQLVVLTEGLKDLVVRRYGVRADRVLVIGSGTDTELFQPRDREASCHEADLDPSNQHIGFLGSFYYYQGLDTLLEAFALVRERRGPVRLLLVGDGEAAHALRQHADRLGVAGVITWTGRVPYERVPRLIGAMDVCVAPFRADRGETSPVKVFDYLACGRPVVAGAIPSVTAIFSEREGVVLVPPDDAPMLASALVRLLEDRAAAGELGRRGRLFIEQHCDWADLTKRLREGIARGAGESVHAHSGVLR